MSNRPLLDKEKYLIVLLVVVLSTGILMSVLIGLVLPSLVTKSSTTEEPNHTTEIASLKAPKRPKATMVHSRDNSTTADKQVMGSGNLYHVGVEQLHYLVSLTYSAEENEGRRYVCSGTILSGNWILVGKVSTITS